MRTVLPLAQHYARLPKKCMAAGVIFVDEQQRVLIVETTYSETWEVPGGYVEANESILDAAVREIREEIGAKLDRTSLRLTTVDYKHADGDPPSPQATEGQAKPESIQFHFWGGVIDPATITVDNDEISSFKFVPSGQLDQSCTPTLARRTQATVEAALENRTVYLEDGYPIV